MVKSNNQRDPKAAAAMLAVGAFKNLRFFPGDEFAQADMVDMLMEMASDPEQLRWLARTVRNHFSEWPGAAQIRAVFCTRYKPADGIEVYLSLSQTETAALQAKLEQRAIDSHAHHKALPPPPGIAALLEGRNL